VLALRCGQRERGSIVGNQRARDTDSCSVLPNTNGL
jgi:hypothetical protein